MINFDTWRGSAGWFTRVTALLQEAGILFIGIRDGEGGGIRHGKVDSTWWKMGELNKEMFRGFDRTA